MRLTTCALLLLLLLRAGAGFSQKAQPPQPDKSGNSLLQKFPGEFNLPAAAESADVRLRRAPKDVAALVVRMEAAELQERPDLVLDSALRICALPAAPELHELASNRILQHAANSWIFDSVLRRVRSAATIRNDCTFNVRLALVAAASDGAKIDLDTAAHSSGLLTRWRIVGPFGRYNNVDLEHRWPPEIERAFRAAYSAEADPVAAGNEHGPAAAKRDISRTIAPERFWFRDGMVTLPEYFPSFGIFYAASDVDLATATNSRIDVLSSGSYEIFVDGKSTLAHDVRYSAGPSRDSSSLKLTAGHHRILVKFTPDAVPFSVALHPQFERPAAEASCCAPITRTICGGNGGIFP